MSKPVRVNLDPEMWRRLRERTAAADVDLAAYIEQLITSSLENEKGAKR